MDGFRDTTRMVYLAGGGAVKGDAGAAKMAKVMHEFKMGKLHSGSKQGPEVTSPKQAIAIALNQKARLAKGGLAKAPPGIRINDPEARALQAVTSQTFRKSDRAAESGAPVQKRKGVPVAPSAPLLGAKHGGLAVKRS